MLSKKCILCNSTYFKATNRGYKEWEARLYCSRKCRSISINPKMENSHNWLGDIVGYNSLHKWVQRNFGKPPHCESCKLVGKKGKRNWNIDWANKTGNYERNKGDWIGLCRKCHTEFDKGQATKKTVSVAPHKIVFKHELITP